MNILIVGAGAVGKVYGRHLALGGANVSFYVKEKYAAAAKAGFHFYVYNDRANRCRPLLWKDYQVLTTKEAVAQGKWDYVILAMSSTGLRSGWIDEFIPAFQNAPIVSLQAGIHDREYLLKRFSAKRVINGTIHIMSYEAPLPGEILPMPGTAYWTPPASAAAFSGDSASLDPLLAVFKRGSFSVKKVPDATQLNVAATPVLTLFVRALECSDWSFEKFKRGEWMNTLCAAIPEAVAIQAKKVGVAPPNVWFLKPLFFKLLLTVARFVVPFDVETYFKVHFSKVQDQMHENVTALIALGKLHHLPTENLQKMKA